MQTKNMTSTPCAPCAIATLVCGKEFHGGILEVSIDGQRTQGGEIATVVLTKTQVNITCSVFFKRDAAGNTWTFHPDHLFSITPQSAWRCGNELVLRQEVRDSAVVTAVLRFSCEHIITLLEPKT